MEEKLAVESLDQLDLTLIKELETDARQSLSYLATKLDVGPMTVYRRLKRLTQSGAIRVTAIPDPLALGYRIYAMIGINARPGKVRAIADRLASFSDVQVILVTTGRYDMLIWVVSQDPEGLLDFITAGMADIRDVTGIQIFTILKFMKSSWTPLTSDIDSGLSREWRTGRDLDKLDISIIDELGNDPRQSITTLAKRVGANRSTVYRKLRALEAQKIIKVISIVDPIYLGYNLSVSMMLEVEPDKILAVAQKLSTLWPIRHLVIMSGSFQIFGHAIFKDTSELNNFLHTEVGSITGILKLESLQALQNPKMSFSLPINRDLGGSK